MSDLFEFKGFKPPVDLRLYGSLVIFQILDYAPEKFSIKAFIKKIKDSYICELKISSESGTFLEQFKAGDPRTALDYVCTGMKNQILDWRRRKFTFNAPSFWHFKKMGGAL